MCRNVEIRITYLNVRLSLRLVRSLRTIRGRLRRFPHCSCSRLRKKWKAGNFAPFSVSEPTLQNALLSRWGATNPHKNHISIKPDRFPIIYNLKDDHRTVSVEENLNNIRPYGNTHKREKCSTATAV